MNDDVFNMRRRRIELGLTLEQVAKYVGVCKSTVSKWENGHIQNMRRDRITRLAEILRISPTAITDLANPLPELTDEDKEILKSVYGSEEDNEILKSVYSSDEKADPNRAIYLEDSGPDMTFNSSPHPGMHEIMYDKDGTVYTEYFNDDEHAFILRTLDMLRRSRN